ncbi:hypothetical protein [Erythrobacter sp. MTPC3]|uniref:hypothetical protein n=1 Tax=Erythrobacter sp. MTPC3 TaxID=3056564 RepID=UPI0036F2E293
MRTALIPIAGLALIAANEPAAVPVATPLDNPAYSEPAEKWSVDTAETLHGIIARQVRPADDNLLIDECADKIMQARDESGLPALGDRQIADPDNPLLYYAVDRREDGCGVMVMKGNRSDIRPVPALPEGPISVIPADAGIPAE